MSDMYVDGKYLKQNPTWDVEDAPWKADHIFRMLEKNHLKPGSVCEIGCGCGLPLLRIRTCDQDILERLIELCKLYVCA